jgi:signal transduction histidine kinase
MTWKPFNRNLFLLSLVLLLIRPASYAGTDSVRYAVSHYSNENGLPQNSVKAIVPDEYGFIWLATEAGLVRFDGRHFSLFNRHNTGIASSRIVGIWRTPAGNQLHAITQNWTLLGISKGKVYPEKGKWESLYKRLLPYSMTHSILPHAWQYNNGPDPYHLDSLQLYLSGDTSLLVTLKGEVNWFRKDKFLHKTHVPLDNKFQRIFTTGPSAYLLPDYLNGNKVLRITKNGADSVLLTGDLLRQAKGTALVLCLNHAERQVFFYANQRLYQVIRQPNGDLHTVLLLQGYDFQKLRVSCCYYDSIRRRIFLGTSISGMFVLSAQPFTVRTCASADRNDNVIYDHVPFSDTSVLTGRGYLFYAGHSCSKSFPLLQQCSKGVAKNLFRATDGTLWTADFNYVYQLSEEATSILQQWPIRMACAFTQMASGEIWAGTVSGDIYALRPGQKMRLLRKIDDRVLCMEQETPSVLWVATSRYLFRCSLPGMRLDTLRELNNQVVRNIYIPRENEVWFCTYEAGFYLYQDGKLTRFPTDRKKYLNTVHHIAEDPKGFFWISTNNGLFKTAKGDLLRYARDKSFLPFYLYYNKESGFNTNEFNGSNQRVGARLADGVFSFASVDGVVFLHPGHFTDELPDAPVVIDKIEVNGRTVPVTGAIRLEHSFSDIRFRIATAYFGNPDNLTYEYRLDDKEWVPVENESFVFNALPAGRHQILIRKRAGFGNSYLYTQTVLEVLPAFWQTWWFRLFALLLLAGVVTGIIRLRTFYLNRKNKQLERTVALRTAELKDIINVLEVSEMKLAEELRLQQRLIGNIAHDIKTPLKFLTLSARRLSNKVEQQEMPEQAEAESIYASSAKIYAFTDNLMTYLKARLESGVVKKELNLREVIEHQKELFDIALKVQGNTFHNEIDPDLQLKTHRQLLSIVLHNLTDNAIKNTRNGHISFTAQKDNHYIKIQLQDNGPGIGAVAAQRYNEYFSAAEIQEKEVYTGFGFLIIKDILPLIDATLTFRNTSGTIATLTISLPEQERQIPESE